jgi:hypothetical protein
MSSNPHDALFKAIFSQPEHATGELRHVLPAALVAHLDFATLKLRPGSFVDKDLREQFTDLLFSIQFAGREGFLYLLFEHRSTPDRLMAFRLLRYMVRIWEKHLKDHPDARRLPLILPVVLYHGEPGWRVEPAFEALYDVSPETLAAAGEHAVRLRFVLDDLRRSSDEALLARAMSALGRVALWSMRNAWRPSALLEGIQRVVRLLHEVLRGPNGLDALAQVIQYILRVHGDRAGEEIVERLLGAVNEEEVKVAMRSAYDYLMEKAHHEGHHQGRSQGKRETLLLLLGERFGALPQALIARIQAAGADELDRWARRVLSAPTLDEVLGEG